MKARITILTITAAVLVALPMAVLAQGAPGGGPGAGAWGHGPHAGGFGPDGGLAFLERMLPRFAEELGLTDEQLQEIQAIVTEESPKIDELSAQMRALHQTRRESCDPAVFNEGEVRAFAAELAQIQVELMVVGDRARSRALQVLSEEQRQQLEEMRGNFGKHLSRRSGGRRPR